MTHLTPALNPAFVFIHGAWHNHHTWDLVVPLLAEKGYASIAIDLPGAGKQALIPNSYKQTPIDTKAFASEPSPNNQVTQADRNKAVLTAIQQAATKGDGRVILVGHSLGGLTLNPVGELAYQQLHAIVYLTAFMLPQGMYNRDFVLKDGVPRSNVLSLMVAKPQEIGAQRINFRSQDQAYLDRIREVFYGDISDQAFESIISRLHPDEPAQVTQSPSPITTERYGRIPRHYIRCTQDKAILIEVQDAMIAAVDASLGNQTKIHTLESGHSPFISMPEALVEILISTV